MLDSRYGTRIAAVLNDRFLEIHIASRGVTRFDTRFNSDLTHARRSPKSARPHPSVAASEVPEDSQCDMSANDANISLDTPFRLDRAFPPEERGLPLFKRPSPPSNEQFFIYHTFVILVFVGEQGGVSPEGTVPFATASSRTLSTSGGLTHSTCARGQRPAGDLDGPSSSAASLPRLSCRKVSLDGIDITQTDLDRCPPGCPVRSVGSSFKLQNRLLSPSMCWKRK